VKNPCQDPQSKTVSSAAWLGFCVALCLGLLLAVPALAAAAPQAVNFDSAPPEPNQPVERSSEAPKITFLPRVGFRPYRAQVPGGGAKTGEFVGDITRCTDEALALGEDTAGCDVLQRVSTTADLSETAESVTLFAGTFRFQGEATLRAFDSAGQEVAHDGPKPVSPGQFNTEFKVERASEEDIASFSFEGDADLGIDAVSAEFSGGGIPDFSIGTTNQVIPIVAGQTAQVPVHISRLNGSTGAIEFGVEHLPDGVRALTREVKKDDETDVAITLEALPSAADTDFLPTDATIVARPRVQTAGRTDRTANFKIRVAQDFQLSSGGVSDREEGRKIPVQVPDCAPADLPISITRDIMMQRDVNLSIENGAAEGSARKALPAGLQAEFLPDAAVHPGGNLVAARTLRLRATPDVARATNPLPLTVRAVDPPLGTPRTLDLEVSRTADATIASRPVAFTPRFGREGSEVRLHGAGFCPGTEVELAAGNGNAKVPATLIDDHTLAFHVPRFATSGKVKIYPPGEKLAPYTTNESLFVDSVRNVNGFAFANEGYPVRRLSLSELVKAFGEDDVFTRVNLCWPFGDCSFSTGIEDPVALADAVWMETAMHSGGGGHCWGMNMAIQLFDSGKERRGDYSDTGASSNYEMAPDEGPGGPGGRLNDFLDAMQVREFSDERLRSWLDRPRDWQKDQEVLEAEFSRGRMPIISIDQPHSRASHAVLAYDMTQNENTEKIYVYENVNPYRPAPEGEGSAPENHLRAVEQGSITIDKRTGTWRFHMATVEEEWVSSINNGSIWVMPTDVVPADPSLPGLGTKAAALAEIISIDSTDGSVINTATSPNSEFMPTSDAGGAPGNGIVAARHRSPAPVLRGRTNDPKQQLQATVEGTKAGRYTEAYVAPGFTATVASVPTQHGVVDRIGGDGDSMTLRSGIARPLRIEAAQHSNASLSSGANVQTHASADGADTVGFADDGDLTYAHSGAATKITFTLTEVREQGGPATFVSPPLAVRDGDRLRVDPIDRDLHRVRVEIHNGGTKRTLVLRSRGGGPGKRLKLGAAKLAGHRLVQRFRVSGLHGGAIVGTVLRLMRGKRLIAHHVVARRSRNGVQKIVWKLPKGLGKGRFRLRADVRLASTGSRGSMASGTVSAHRTTNLKIG
jgi:hypothetical protein